MCAVCHSTSLTPLGVPPPGGARFRIPGVIYAIQHIRNLRGGSQAKLMSASDGYWYIVKLMGNPQGLKVLANEMFASSIATHLRLPVPHTEIIEVDDWLIENTPDLRVEGIGSSRPFTSGLQLGSRYAAEHRETPVFDYIPESFAGQIANLADFPRCLVLDKWLANSDGRQAVFTKEPRQRKRRVTFIDHGYCFNAEEWSFPDLPLMGVYYRNWVYRDVRGWDSFEPALTIAEQMDIDDLWYYAQKIPPEWYGAKESALSELVETLHRRRPLIRGLILAFRESSRNPFPLWT